MGGIVRSKYGLEVENQKLKDEIAARDAAALELDTLKSENESLKNTLGRTGKAQVTLGVIISRPPVSLYDTLVLDIGTNDGIKVGDKVYASGDVLIGDIAEVYSSESKVSLYSTPGRITPVLVGTSTIAASAMGKGGGNFVIKLPVSTKVVQGAVITIPHIRVHTFGVIDAIQVDSSDSLQTILFRSPVNVNQLQFVEVEEK
jgi:cell shape-determining protein MreC